MPHVIKHNLHQFLICFDQFLNVLVCSVILPHEKSWADETFSSRCWRWHLNGVKWPGKVVNAIMFWDKNHCEMSFESERQRTQAPPESRV